ncbi:transcription factor S [Candidatus Pacearchaeota archaeon]|nr:transcription factor S [Candidatus Pacearchaeota archaeon]
MEFCEKCGGIILIQGDKAACASCGHKPKKKVKLEASEKIIQRDTIAVIKEDQSNTYPIVQIKCPKCGNNSAYFWTTQTRASDESETKFYKCLKCKHTWRVYR